MSRTIYPSQPTVWLVQPEVSGIGSWKVVHSDQTAEHSLKIPKKPALGSVNPFNYALTWGQWFRFSCSYAQINVPICEVHFNYQELNLPHLFHD